MLQNIMEQPPHHLDMTIPLYKLEAAQRQLDKLVQGQISKRPLTEKAFGMHADLQVF